MPVQNNVWHDFRRGKRGQSDEEPNEMLSNLPNPVDAATINETPDEKHKPPLPPVPKPKVKPDTTDSYQRLRRSNRPTVELRADSQTDPSMNHYESIPDETVLVGGKVHDGNPDTMTEENPGTSSPYLSLVAEPNLTGNVRSEYEELQF